MGTGNIAIRNTAKKSHMLVGDADGAYVADIMNSEPVRPPP